MEFKELIEITEKLVSISAIVIGGIWIYFNFIKGRIYRPRLSPEITGTIILEHGQVYLHITSTISNVGNSVVALQQKGTGFRLLGYERNEEIRDVQGAVWEHLATFSVFEKHGWLEGKETIQDERLVVVPLSKYRAFRLELRVVSNKISWTNTSIITFNPEEETQHD